MTTPQRRANNRNDFFGSKRSLWDPPAAATATAAKPQTTQQCTKTIFILLAGVMMGMVSSHYREQFMNYRDDHVVMSVLVSPQSKRNNNNMSNKDGTGITSVSRPGNAHRDGGGLPKAVLDQWCPLAECEVTDLCNPCKRRYLILVATGRSGSTTLQWMFDSLPGVRISGENGDALPHTEEMVQKTTAKEWNENQSPMWKHETYPESAFTCVAQKFFEIINPPPNNNGRHVEDDRQTIVGFKTIRVHKEGEEEEPIRDYDKLVARAKYIQRTFPCSRVIINIRSDVKRQAKSQKINLGERTNLTFENEMLTKFANFLGPQQAMLIDSNDWIKEPSSINKVVSWLGFHESCHFEKAFELNIKRYQIGQSNRTIHTDCTRLSF